MPGRAHPDRLQTLIIDGSQGYHMAPGEDTIEIRRGNRHVQTIPQRRIGQVICRRPHEETLRALLSLTARGHTIQFQDGRGGFLAALVPAGANVDARTNRIVSAIECMDPRPVYGTWLGDLHAHIMSRILRRSPRCSIQQFERQLVRYARRPLKGHQFDTMWHELQGLLRGWLYSELVRRRLLGLSSALAWRQCHLYDDLRRSLSMPLLWWFSAWVRPRRYSCPRDRLGFFDRVRPRLDDEMTTAIIAFYYHIEKADQSCENGVWAP